ncbi:MAG: CoA transferase [Dehalococcoidia bacterium]
MAPRLPLEGIRVADLSWIIAGPYGTYLLARMGAEVIKIEGLEPMEHIRDNPPHADNVRGPNRSGFFNTLNAAKKSVTLQLRDPEQGRMAKEIIAQSDVVIEAFSYGTIDKLGFGYEELRRIKQDIIMLSCSGFGRTGRDRTLRAFMGTVHAYTGLNSVNGHVGGPPKPAGGTWADYVTGISIVFATLAALRHRHKTGCGQYIDLSMADVVLSTMGAPFMEYFMNGRVGQTHGNTSATGAPNNVYRCKGDDAWVAISVETDAQWDALCAVVADDDLRTAAYRTPDGRRKHAEAIDARISAWAKTRTPLEATDALQRAGVPSGPSSSAADLLAQPQLRARGFFVAPEHPETGRRAIPNLPWRLASSADTPCAPAPLLGQHNQEVLSGLLGRSQKTIDRINAKRDEIVREHSE